MIRALLILSGGCAFAALTVLIVWGLTAPPY